jgi:hypothetical protein
MARRIERTNVAPWVVELTEDIVGPSPVEVGKKYDHPDYGPIRIISGEYWGLRGLSNHWHWIVLETGEERNGYGGNWPEIEADDG